MADEGKFTQADIDAAVKAATEKVQESIDRLEAKNEELVGENRKAKAAARAASEIKPEDLTAAEDRAEKAEARIKELEKAAKDATTAKEKAEKALEDETGFTSKLLIQDGLKSALLANGVKDDTFIDALTAKFAAGATVVTEGDVRKAMIGDKSLDDAIKEFAASEPGKKFVSAPVNGGGGADGGRTIKADAKTMTRAAYNALSQTEQGELGEAMRKGDLKIVDEAA